MQTSSEQGSEDSVSARPRPSAANGSSQSRPQSLSASVTGLLFAAADHYITMRKDRLIDAVVDIAAEVRRSGRRFEGRQDWIADGIDRGVSRIRDAAENLRAADSYDLFEGGLAFARRRPRATLVMAVLAGAAGARLLKHRLRESASRVAPAH
ncbi:hypothetical protein [Sphingomonas crocodyli]|uniref:DUF883 family protein n=1 Tax=Sphingomonas crocodyli TaxID=1979270 RepID=A0A437LYB5_9SPHN|nr:hypothetical protein [Sphingomonas crocodyli]RVT90355.1 hypothetical protein EOD43_18995 [Sphingomonas crocodyli]